MQNPPFSSTFSPSRALALKLGGNLRAEKLVTSVAIVTFPRLFLTVGLEVMFPCSFESGFEQLKGALPGLRMCAGHMESESSALVTLPTKVSSVAFLRNPRKTSGFLLARWRARATLRVWAAATLHLSAPVETLFSSLGSGRPACMWYPRLLSGSEREERPPPPGEEHHGGPLTPPGLPVFCPCAFGGGALAAEGRPSALPPGPSPWSLPQIARESP